LLLVNEASMPHSIDFHAARIPMNKAFRTIVPHDSLSFEFVPPGPGACLVHCGTPPVLIHLMQGMYLPIIVDPRHGWPGKADKEFVIVQSEFYVQGGDSALPGQPNWTQALGRQASYVVFNGRAFQYQEHPLEVAVGDRVRLFVVNAGPSFSSGFHVVEPGRCPGAGRSDGTVRRGARRLRSLRRRSASPRAPRHLPLTRLSVTGAAPTRRVTAPDRVSVEAALERGAELSAGLRIRVGRE